MTLKHYYKKGSIGITIVMLVFCFMMSVTMAYHKQLQTETLIHKQVDYSDKAMDAAFSGINYAMARIQSEKKVFTGGARVLFLKNAATSASANDIRIKSDWMCLDKDMQFSNYYDDKTRVNGSTTEIDRNPPYRFKVGCNTGFYFLATDTIYIKSIGEYIKYDGSELISSYTAQLIAECTVDKTAKTIRIKKYRKMNVKENKLFTFKGYDEE